MARRYDSKRTQNTIINIMARGADSFLSFEMNYLFFMNFFIILYLFLRWAGTPASYILQNVCERIFLYGKKCVAFGVC